ncbi:hypothetical protein MN0502_01810 [Arthrobacter sp. MN05-02]|nr:hypothetical protein MN0502_01810 [Arthrobacter sp. MN05-02]
MEARISSGESGFGRLMPRALLMLPTRPNRVPYMKPHIRLATTAGTAYGRKIEMRKKDFP